jgi:hypothetical protein
VLHRVHVAGEVVLPLEYRTESAAAISTFCYYDKSLGEILDIVEGGLQDFEGVLSITR